MRVKSSQIGHCQRHQQQAMHASILAYRRIKHGHPPVVGKEINGGGMKGSFGQAFLVTSARRYVRASQASS